MLLVLPAPESNQADIEKVLAFSMSEYVCSNSRASVLYIQKKIWLKFTSLYEKEELLMASFFPKVPKAYRRCAFTTFLCKRGLTANLCHQFLYPCVRGGGHDLS